MGTQSGGFFCGFALETDDASEYGCQKKAEND
jgi:hypothetical protein